MEHIYRKIALLVDAGSIDPERLPDIILKLSAQGQVVTRQVFGDWSNPKLSVWVSAARTCGVRLIHQPCYTQGGNEVPILMSLYAAELFQQQDIDTIAIATHREEFVPLATYLREAGAYTILCCAYEVSSIFKSAFDENFICGPRGQSPVGNQDIFSGTFRANEDLETTTSADVIPKTELQEGPVNTLFTDKAEFSPTDDIEEIIIRDTRVKSQGTTTLCTACGRLVPYAIKGQLDTHTTHGIQFSYTEQIAVCSICGKEVYVPEVNDWNIRIRIAAFQKAQRAKENKEREEEERRAARNNGIKSELTEKQKVVLDYLRDHPNITCHELEKVLSVKYTQARHIMRQLWMLGLVNFTFGRHQIKHYFLKPTASAEAEVPETTDK